MKSFSFDILYRSKESQARLGVIHTPHGDIQTPAFIPVGTQASVKSLTPSEIKEVGTQLFFVNTYHMAMRPGIELVKKMGGLHQFMQWDGPIITDSGGFQVFSLARRSPESLDEGGPARHQSSEVGLARQSFSEGGPARHQSSQDRSLSEAGLSRPKDDGEPSLVKITEEGVKFRSHWDGSYHEFTPESSMEYQWDLGSDIHIAFDDCTPYPVTSQEAKKSMDRTHRWATRSMDAHKSRMSKDKSQKTFSYQALYGSIQGSVYETLRKESATFISKLDTDGIAIGGVSVGETKEEMYNVLEWVMPILPSEKPRHLLGVGEIDDIFQAVKQGIDTFDCVQATRLARMGYCYTKNGIEDVNKKIHADNPNPLDLTCQCYTCKTYSKAYIHHLFRVHELLGYRLTTMHNLFFLHALVTSIRKAIEHGTLLELEREWLIR